MAGQVEQTLLDEGGVLVSNARIVTKGQTYAMANVVSVSLDVRTGEVQGPGLILAVGIVLFVGGAAFASDSWTHPPFSFKAVGVSALGIAVGVLGGWLFSRVKPWCTVVLQNSAGMAKAVVTNDREFADRVVVAVNNAMISRG